MKRWIVLIAILFLAAPVSGEEIILAKKKSAPAGIAWTLEINFDGTVSTTTYTAGATM